MVRARPVRPSAGPTIIGSFAAWPHRAHDVRSAGGEYFLHLAGHTGWGRTPCDEVRRPDRSQLGQQSDFVSASLAFTTLDQFAATAPASAATLGQRAWGCATPYNHLFVQDDIQASHI